MARIVLLKDGQAFPYELKDFPAKLGRHPDCDIQLDSNMVSRFHAQLVLLDGRILLEDLGSGNGSFLNGKQLEKHQPHVLKDGDRITIDATRKEVLLAVSDEELAKRKSDWTAPVPPQRGVLAKYARHVRSASLGAVTDF